jgi:hypothetical protein
MLVSLGAPLAAQACSTHLPKPFEGADAAVPLDSGGADDASIAAPIPREDAGPCGPKDYIPAADSGADQCAVYVRYECGLPSNVTQRNNCFFSLAACQTLCQDLYYFNCHAWTDSCVDGSVPDGGVTVECTVCPGVAGRRPDGLRPLRVSRAPRVIGEHLASVAHLEAASVHAFRILRRELADLGAPRLLAKAAARAMRDEARHARVITRLAKKNGAVTARARVRRTRGRTLEAFAIENAVEGCVRETYGALFAQWQAAHAGDPEVATAMARIARDETRHAALAWAIADWVEPRLDPEARARVAVRRAHAVIALERELRGDPDAELVRGAGVPTAAEHRALVRGLVALLWGRGAAPERVA